MASDSLGQLTVDLIANTGGFEAGMDRVQRSLKSATKEAAYQATQLDKLVGQIDPVVGAYGRLDKMEEQLRAHRKAGRLDVSDFDEYLKILNQQRESLGLTDKALGKNAQQFAANGQTLKQYQNNLRGIPAQFTDIIVSLQGGQKPLTVFLQQGGQLKDMFGGAGSAAKALGGYVVGLVNPLTVAAAAAVVLAVAYKEGSNEGTAFKNSLSLTGNTAGTTSEQLAGLAKQVSDSSGTVGKASDVLAQLAATTRIPVAAFEMIAESAVKFESATGQAASETVKNFEKISKDPVKASLDLNESLNYLTASTYEQIKAMQAQGDAVGAQTLAEAEYAKAISTRADSIKSNLGSIETGWEAVKKAAKGAWDAVLDVGREQTYAEKMADLQTQLTNAARLPTGARGSGNRGTAQINQDISDLNLEETDRKRRAAAKGLYQQIQQDGVIAEQAIGKIRDDALSNAEKREKEIAAYRLNLERVRAANPNSALLDEKKIAQDIANINDKYADKKEARAKAYVEDAGTKELDQAKEQYAVLQQQAAQLDEQTGKAKTLGAAQQELIKWEQQLADIKTKDTLTAAQKSLLATADQITKQKELNAALEKDTAARTASALQAAQLAEFQQKIVDDLSRSQRGLDDQVVGVGLGAEGRKRLKDDLSIQQDYADQVERLRRDKLSGKITQETYDKETSILDDALQKRMAMQKDYYQKLDQAQADWKNGANAALQDYANETKNIAGQTYTLFSDGLHGVEDMFVDLAVTGKASFKSLANSIIGDLARIVAKAYVVGPILSFLGLSGDSSRSGSLGVGGGSTGGGITFGNVFGATKTAVDGLSSSFGQAIVKGWNSGDGPVAGLESAFKNGADYISTTLTSAFNTGSQAAAGVLADGVYNLGANGSAATVDLINNSVSVGGQTVGTASDFTTTAASSSLETLSIALSYIQGVYTIFQSFQQYGLKGAAVAGGAAAAGAYVGSFFGPLGTAAGFAIGAVVGAFGADKWFGTGEKYPELSTSSKGTYADGKYTSKGWVAGWNEGEPKFGNSADAAIDSTVQKFTTTLGMIYSAFGSDASVSLADTMRQRRTSGAYSSGYSATLDNGNQINIVQQHAGGDFVQGLQDNYDDVMGTLLAQSIIGSSSVPAYFKAQFQKFANDWDATAEDVVGTIEGIFTRFNGVNDAVAAINIKTLKLDDTGLMASDSVLNLVASISDLDATSATAKDKVKALQDLINTYYSAFFSQSEQFQDLTDRLTSNLGAFGVKLPDTREAYRAMVEDIDLTTAAGQALFATLMGLASSADAYYTEIAKRQDTYYAAFYSESENTARSVAAITDEFKKANITLPSTRAGYRAMAEGIDQTTASGKKLYETLMALSGDADTFYKAQEQASATAVSNAISVANSAMSALQRSVNAEKTKLTDAYNDQVTALNAVAAAAQSSISDLTTMGSALDAALKALNGTSDTTVKMLRAQAQATIAAALAFAQGGGSLAGYTGLTDALSTVSDNNTDLYSSLEDFNREQGRTANIVAQLSAINGDQLTVQEQVLKSAQDQLVTLKALYDLQIQALDDDLARAQAQLDALNGVDTSIISVRDAVNAMNAAVVAALSAMPRGSAAANTPGNNSSLLDAVYQSVLGRDADSAGEAYWTGLLQSGAIDYAGLAAQIKADAQANGELPHYAKGTNNWDGSPALVGEFGPEIVTANNLGGSTIYPAQRSNSLLSGGPVANQDAQDAQNWRDKALKKLNEIARNTGWLDIWNSDGLPAVRA